MKRWEDLPDCMQNDAVRPYWEILNKRRGQLVLKRSFDLVFACILLILLFIPMAFISIAIKLDSSGPIFYRQERELCCCQAISSGQQENRQ